jgi:hypothetical protein
VQEPPVDDRDVPRVGLVLDPERADRQPDQQRGVAVQDANLAFRPTRDDLDRGAGPDLAIGGDERDLQGHR